MPTPSILLIPDRYKAAVLYSQIPDSGAVDFSVTRATTAYRTNASGILESVASGVPRLDYPIGGGCPSLLVEPAATNLALYSEEFDDAYWVKSGTAAVSANTTTAPNGDATADTLSGATGTTFSNNVLQRPITVASSTQYTASIWIKLLTANSARLYLRDSSTGLQSSVSALPTTEWQRISFARISGAGTTGFNFFVGNTDGDVAVWGAQLETGSVATSYIPTVAATATRNADVISKTGVSGFIGQTEGCLYAEVDANSLTGSRIIEIGDGTSVNRIFLRFSSPTNLNTIGSVGGVNEWSLNAAVSAGILKVAVAYAQDDIVLYVNGLLADSDSSANIPAVGNVYLGYAPYITDSQLNDRIRAAAIYPTRLTNSQLESLTTL
jgi:hypothetical protein